MGGSAQGQGQQPVSQAMGTPVNVNQAMPQLQQATNALQQQATPPVTNPFDPNYVPQYGTPTAQTQTPAAATTPAATSIPGDRGAAFLSPGQQPGQVWSPEQAKWITPQAKLSYGLAGATPVYGQSLAQMQANGLSSFGNTPPGMIWSTEQGRYVTNPMPNAPAKPGVSIPPGMTWSTVAGKYVPLPYTAGSGK